MVQIVGVLDCVLEVLNDPLLVNDTDTVVQPELLMVLDWLTVSDDVKVPEGHPEEDRLDDCEGVSEEVTTEVELNVLRGEEDTLKVPEPQRLLVTEALGVVEREGEMVGDSDTVLVTEEVATELEEREG